MTAPPPELRDWVRETVGGDARWEPHPASGRSRLIWVVRPSATPGRALLLRAETGLGPFAGTEFTLAREASVLRALAGTGVPVPAVHGAQAGHVLMDLLPGTVEIDLADDAGRTTMTAYCTALATLHRLDPAVVPLPRPASAADHALLDLAAHQRSYRLGPPNRAAEEAFDRLHATAPAEATRTSLLHGDAGPGNFLHSGGRITGLIDWEMAHVGDPMDDLAWLWFRKCFLRGDADLPYWYARYGELSGEPVDLRRIGYYRVQVLVRAATAVLNRQQYEPKWNEAKADMIVGLVRDVLLDPFGDRGDPQALAPLALDATFVPQER